MALHRKELWRKSGDCAFVLSPHGVGLDRHRTSEALSCNHIVPLPSSPQDKLHEGLPAIPLKGLERDYAAEPGAMAQSLP